MSVRDNEAEGEIRRLTADVARLTAALATETERAERYVGFLKAEQTLHGETRAERDGLRAALAPETSNANAYARQRDESRKQVDYEQQAARELRTKIARTRDLVEAAREIDAILLDPEAREEIDSFTGQTLHEALVKLDGA